jgi:hypothetical protein
MTQSRKQQETFGRLATYGNRNEDDSEKRWRPRLNPAIIFTNATASVLPTWLVSSSRAILGVTLVLYILNQNHVLPKPLSAIVSKALFWPTVPITVGRRLGQWYTVIDETVIMGGAPFGFANIPERLHEKYGVSVLFLRC